jgi:hypothetical protein
MELLLPKMNWTMFLQVDKRRQCLQRQPKKNG